MNSNFGALIVFILTLLSCGGLYFLGKASYKPLSPKDDSPHLQQFLTIFFVGFFGALISYILVLGWSAFFNPTDVYTNKNPMVMLILRLPPLLASFFFLGNLIYGIRIGTIVKWGRAGLSTWIVNRNDSPSRFWMVCILYFILGMLFLIQAIWGELPRIS